eukprot:555283_1
MSQLNHRHHIISQFLFAKSCVTEQQLKTELQIQYEDDEDDEIDLDDLINVINRFYEQNEIGIQIENHLYIDGKMYYGFRMLVIDDIAKQSMISLNEKQIFFWKILLNICIENSGIFSLEAALNLNDSGLLPIKNRLQKTEIISLINTLQKGKYINKIDENQFDDEKSEQTGGKYYVLGPRTFIDTKNWIDTKTEYSDNECCLCKMYVLFEGYKCSHNRCKAIMHKPCINNYIESFNNNNNNKYKCPQCLNQVQISNDNVNQILSNPNNALSIIENLKRKNDKEKRLRPNTNMQSENNLPKNDIRSFFG